MWKHECPDTTWGHLFTLHFSLPREKFVALVPVHLANFSISSSLPTGRCPRVGRWPGLVSDSAPLPGQQWVDKGQTRGPSRSTSGESPVRPGRKAFSFCGESLTCSCQQPCSRRWEGRWALGNKKERGKEKWRNAEERQERGRGQLPAPNSPFHSLSYTYIPPRSMKPKNSLLYAK